jgi:hypothetical protein
MVEFSLVFSLSKVRREIQVVASKPGGREEKWENMKKN